MLSPAIMSAAIEDALSPYGVQITSLPITAEQIVTGSHEGEVTMRATGFNHVSIHALDLEESVRFYTEVFGMERIPTYAFAFPVQYLRLGDLQLHLFQRDTEAPSFHHIGINVDDFARPTSACRSSASPSGLVLRGHVRAARRQRADVPARPRGQPRRDRLARRDDDRPHARAGHPQARRQRPADGRGPAGDALPRTL